MISNIPMNMARNSGMPENYSLRWNIPSGAISIMPLRKPKPRAKPVDLMCMTILLMSTKWSEVLFLLILHAIIALEIIFSKFLHSLYSRTFINSLSSQYSLSFCAIYVNYLVILLPNKKLPIFASI